MATRVDKTVVNQKGADILEQVGVMADNGIISATFKLSPQQLGERILSVLGFARDANDLCALWRRSNFHLRRF